MTSCLSLRHCRELSHWNVLLKYATGLPTTFILWRNSRKTLRHSILPTTTPSNNRPTTTHEYKKENCSEELDIWLLISAPQDHFLQGKENAVHNNIPTAPYLFSCLHTPGASHGVLAAPFLTACQPWRQHGRAMCLFFNENIALYVLYAGQTSSTTLSIG